MSDSLKTKSGREVFLHGVHLQHFARGVYAGKPAIIRDEMLKRLPGKARSVFPGKAGLFVEAVTEENEAYPTWVVICEFHSYEPINPDADCSALICCWFTDKIEDSLHAFIAPRIATIDWEQLAEDGLY